MVKEIVQEAFKKAAKECVSKAKNTLAKHISSEIEESNGFIINYKTLVRAYDTYIGADSGSVIQPSSETVNAFCLYLGYENYKDYINAKNKTTIERQQGIAEIEKELLPVKKQRSKWFLSVALLTIIGILGLLLFKVSGIGNNVDTIANQCLYWELDRYRPIDCDKVLPQAIAKTKVAFSETLYNDFRKVPNNEIATFSTALWKGSSPTGEMEYFATEGVHPLTQKKLVRVEPETIKTNFKKGKAERVENGIKVTQDGAVSFQNASGIPKEDAVAKTKDRDDISKENTTKSSLKDDFKGIENSIGIFIFNENELDRTVARQLEKTVLKEYQTKLISPIPSKQQLLNGTITGLSNLENICVGSVSYTFKENTGKITCELRLNFDTFATQTRRKIKDRSGSITRYGIGFSKQQAKEVAIAKVNGL